MRWPICNWTSARQISGRAERLTRPRSPEPATRRFAGNALDDLPLSGQLLLGDFRVVVRLLSHAMGLIDMLFINMHFDHMIHHARRLVSRYREHPIAMRAR